jgi:hypothetical protein
MPIFHISRGQSSELQGEMPKGPNGKKRPNPRQRQRISAKNDYRDDDKGSDQ